MATSKIAVSEGTGKNLATNSFSEDAVTKELSRVVLNNSSGTEITPQTDALTDTELRASAVPVDGSGVTQPVSASSLPLPTGAATSANQQTDALTDTELRATPVPVSGTVTETNSATIAGDTTSIDGKITACNTGAVVIGSELPAGTQNIGDVDIASALPAGDNNIGNVDLASSIPAGTNNIGDVDVASSSIDGSINGPAEPTIDSYTQAVISAVTGANQQLIAAPGASKQIWVYGVEFGNTTAGTVAFQDEDDTAITGAMPFADNGGMAVPPSGNFAMPLWKVPTNKALEVDVTTGTINGSISYAIVSV